MNDFGDAVEFLVVLGAGVLFVLVVAIVVGVTI